MTTVPVGRQAATTTAAPSRRLHVVAPAKPRLLDRPLASYYLVLGSAGLLVVLGLIMVLSASSISSFKASGNSYALFLKQAMWMLVGLVFAVVAARLPLSVVRRLGAPVAAIAGAGLFAVLVPGIGVSAYGATRWIGVGSLTVQPSEIAKLGLAVWGADLLVRKWKLLGDTKHLLVPLVPVGALMAALVMFEPDMGTTIVLMLVLVALLWVVGAPAAMFGVFLGVVASLGGLLAIAEPYRLARLTNFLHPFADSQGNGFQAVQGIYALSAGGWWGRGLGSSAEKWGYLPNAHTDFIFAIIGEELGLVGTLLVIVLFATLGYAGFRIAARTPDRFVRLASAAITVWLVGQAVVNMGAVVGVLPITGIPLPLISFGGSALVPSMVAIGLLASFARTEKGVPARRRRRAVRSAVR